MEHFEEKVLRRELMDFLLQFLLFPKNNMFYGQANSTNSAIKENLLLCVTVFNPIVDKKNIQT